MTLPTAVFTSPWVPRPLIEACGFTAVPLYSPTKNHPIEGTHVASEGRCPWSRAFESTISKRGFDAVIMTTTCDQMRRTAELLETDKCPVFVLSVPSSRSLSSMRLYLSELHRLTSFLENISGTCLSAEGLACASEYLKPRASDRKARTSLCLLGSHLPISFESFESMLEDKGAYIAVDGLEEGPAFIPDLKEIHAGDSPRDILDAMGEAYFSQIKDAFSRPNSAFYRWLSVQLKREAPRGIVVTRNCWCDKWAIEILRIREWANVPVLELEFTSGELSASAQSRLDAFLETCRQ